MNDHPPPESPKIGRRTANRLATEEAILQAAEAVFADAGFGGATMHEIAARAGLPKANLHYYFATKEDLYRRVVERIFDIWLEAAATMDAASGPRDGIAAYIDAKMEISRRHPNGSKVWASEVMHGAPVIQDYLETTLRDWTAGRVALIETWIAQGQMKPVDPHALLYLLWATTQHYADFSHQIEVLNQGPLSNEDWQNACQTVKSVILRGLGLT